MQNGILYGLGYPAYLTLRNPNTPLGASDALLTVLALLDLLAEFVADNQQYSFQTYKHSKPRVLRPRNEGWFWARQRWTEEDAKRGFVVRGLWAWSRHPNFAAEQTFWVSGICFQMVYEQTADHLIVAHGFLPYHDRTWFIGPSIF
jgi:steroid 5-alpha reductase family enzyme